MRIDYTEDMPEYVSFDEDELPDIKKWKVGGTYTVEIDIKQKSVSQDREMGPKGKDELRARFEVLAVRPVKKSSGSYSKDVIEKAMKR